jgi:hypothetical protein
MRDFARIKELIEVFYKSNINELYDVVIEFIEHLYRDSLDDGLPLLNIIETELSQSEFDFVFDNRGIEYELLHMTYSDIAGDYYIVRYYDDDDNDDDDTYYLLLSVKTTSKHNPIKLVLLDLNSLEENYRFDLKEFRVFI